MPVPAQLPPVGMRPRWFHMLRDGLLSQSSCCTGASFEACDRPATICCGAHSRSPWLAAPALAQCNTFAVKMEARWTAQESCSDWQHLQSHAPLSNCAALQGRVSRTRLLCSVFLSAASEATHPERYRPTACQKLSAPARTGCARGRTHPASSPAAAPPPPAPHAAAPHRSV